MRGSWLKKLEARRLIVHTLDDNSFEGLLKTVAEDGVVLQTAQLLGANAKPLDMAGEVFIPRENIAFVQVG